MTVRTVVWGLGNMGAGIARALVNRKDIRVVGAISRHAAGKDLGEAIGLNQCLGIRVLPDARGLQHFAADMVVIATGSFVEEVSRQVLQAIQAGCNVITIAEEMAYPWECSPTSSEDMHRKAQRAGVTVLGTGINPGFVLDTLIIALTAVCLEVNRIRAARVNDLSPFGPSVMISQGVGTSLEEFETGLAQGTIVGHVGFRQSIGMIARALGWGIDEIEEEREPIISSAFRETPHVKVRPGYVAGCRHRACGIRNGEAVITLDHPQQVRPEAEGVITGDYITIEGNPSIEVRINPEIPGGIGTIAMATNMIPLVLNAEPGLVSMDQLPLPRVLPREYMGLAERGEKR